MLRKPAALICGFANASAPRFLDGFKDVEIQPFMPDRPVVALDIGVLLRLSGLDVVQGSALLLNPDHKGGS